MEIKHTLCPSCSVGCGLNIISSNDEVVGTFPYKRHPVNEGKNCLNGRESIDKLNDKVISPLISGNESELDVIIDNIADMLGSDNVGIIASGRNTNEELAAIKELAEKCNCNVACFADNFPNYDGEIATYDEVDNADSILLIGDVLFENPLIGRRVIHAIDNDADVIAIGKKEKTVSSINASEYIQADSVSAVINEAAGALHDEAIIIVNDINDFDEFELILEKANEVNAKILPVFSQPNTKGAMNLFEVSSADDIQELIRSCDVVLSFKDDLFDYADGAKIVSFSPYVTEVTKIADIVVPVKPWVEIEGTFTNAMGSEQKFNISSPMSETLSEVEIINKILERV